MLYLDRERETVTKSITETPINIYVLKEICKKSFLMDLSKIENCQILYNELKDEDIDVVINDAGFGIQGEFTEISMYKEINLINLNIIALHTLTKLFLQKMKNCLI